MSEHRRYAWLSRAWIFLALAGFPGASAAVTVEELAALLSTDEPVRIIDIRSSRAYQQNRIPGAINIPARAIAYKSHPAYGRTVVYGDGLHPDRARQAVEVLNNVSGIRAEALEGGMIAWQARRLPDAGATGMSASTVPMLNYQELVVLSREATNLILVDLRSGTGNEDLGELFPGVPAIQAGDARLPADSGFLYVLIGDTGGGVSQTVAVRWVGGAARRVAILAGGEQSLRARGTTELRTIRQSSGNHGTSDE